MKLSLARTAGLLAFLGGTASLVGFWLLPFSTDPMAGDIRSGIQVLWDYGVLIVENKDVLNRIIPDPGIVSYASLWALLILFALLTFVSLLLILRRKSGRVLPLLCLVLSLVAVPCLFLAFYRFTFPTSYGNVWQQIFVNTFPFIAFGWWVSAVGVLLTLVASLVVLLGKGKHSAFPRDAQRDVSQW